MSRDLDTVCTVGGVEVPVTVEASTAGASCAVLAGGVQYCDELALGMGVCDIMSTEIGVPSFVNCIGSGYAAAHGGDADVSEFSPGRDLSAHVESSM